MNRILFSTMFVMLTLIAKGQDAGTEISQIWDGSQWVNYQKTTRAFITDEDDNCYTTEIHNWYWNGANAIWVENAREFITYDADFVKTSTFAEYFDTVTDDWVSNYQQAFTYNPDGTLASVTLQNYIDDEWVNLNLRNYTYTDGLLSFYSFYLWDVVLEEWTNGQQETYTYDVSDNLIETFTETWNSDLMIWQNQYELANTYTDDLLTGAVRTAWQLGTEVWINQNSYNHTYNTDDQIELTVAQIWNAASEQWVNQLHDEYTYFNDADAYLQQLLSSLWNNSNQSWNNSVLTTYSNYCINVSMENEFTVGAAVLFPNPGKELNLQTNLAAQGLSTLLVHDVTGRLVYQNTLTIAAGLQNQSIQFNYLPAGEYQITLSTASRILHGKWLKE